MLENMSEFRLPRVLICGMDVTSDDSVPPLWQQITISLAKTYPQGLQIDVAAHLAPNRDAGVIRENLTTVSQYINCDSLATVHHTNHVPLKPHHTHVVFCGIKPPRTIQPEVTAIYVPTTTFPPHAHFPFDRLGYRGFVVLREPEARTLLDEMDPEQTARSAVAPLRARALARALAVQPALEVLQGVVIARGAHGIDGCVASAKVLVPAPFDDDEDIDDDDTEERYEFDIPKPIIEAGNLDPRGAYATFVGKFIGSLIVASAGAPPIDVYSESQMSFQLETACVAAATIALTPAPSNAPMDLAARIPTLAQLHANVSQYIYGLHMLRAGEEAHPINKGSRPVKVRISWPAPAASPPPSPMLAAALRGAFIGIVQQSRGHGSGGLPGV